MAHGEPPGEEEHGPAGRRQQEPQHVQAGEQGLQGREKKGGREGGMQWGLGLGAAREKLLGGGE